MRTAVATMWTLLMLCLLSLSSHAAIESHDFANDVERKRYQSFIEEMRCPKCQNQNLAGSDSPISLDLRRELYVMIKDGLSDKEIVDFMVERYGDFILYRPRVSPATYALWGVPVVLLITGIVVILLMLRRRVTSKQINKPLSVNEQARLESLLSNAPENTNPNLNNNKETRS